MVSNLLVASRHTGTSTEGHVPGAHADGCIKRCIACYVVNGVCAHEGTHRFRFVGRTLSRDDVWSSKGESQQRTECTLSVNAMALRCCRTLDAAPEINDEDRNDSDDILLCLRR